MPNTFADREKAAAAGRKSKPGKQKRIKQWEQLAESIVTEHADRFNRVLRNLNDEDFADQYVKVLNYFKPRINHNVNENLGEIKIEYKNLNDDDKDKRL